MQAFGPVVKALGDGDVGVVIIRVQRLGAEGVAGFHDLDPTVTVEAGAGGDEVAHDDVFLEPAQVVHLAQGRRFREDAGGVLERGGGDERIRLQRRLGNAEQHRQALGGLAALFQHFDVFGLEVELVHLVAPEKRGVARLGDFHLAEHLADNDFDVLVVDLDALEAVNLLDLVDQVLLEFLRPADVEQVMRDAASRTFCTAGNNKPMRIAMIAMTTNNSMSVNPDRELCFMANDSER